MTTTSYEMSQAAYRAIARRRQVEGFVPFTGRCRLPAPGTVMRLAGEDHRPQVVAEAWHTPEGNMRIRFESGALAELPRRRARWLDKDGSFTSIEWLGHVAARRRERAA